MTMRRMAAAGVALAALALGAPSAQAGVYAGGYNCGFASQPDGSATIEGGPIAAVDLPAAQPDSTAQPGIVVRNLDMHATW